MKQRTIFEIGGKTYMSPKAAEDKWNNISRQKIVAECEAGKIIGAQRDSTNKWIIPIEALQPIDDEAIRKILISLLCLKNNPNLEINDGESEQIELVVDYLKKTGFLENDSSTNLRNLVLTEKGIHLATEGKKLQLDWLNAGITLAQVVGSIASIWSAVQQSLGR